MENTTPSTLLEAVRYFSDLNTCHNYMVAIRWPDGKVTCPECGGENVGCIASRRMFQCKAKECRRQFSIKVGTIMEDSPIGLDKWLAAIWLIVNAKNGISSWELHRSIGVTQKTAWFLLHRIRLAMQTGSFERQLTGTVEADETFIGGKAKFMHKSKRAERIQGRGTVGKVVVQGVLERDGEVRVSVVPNQKKGTLQKKVKEYVTPGAAVFTDTLRSYDGLDADFVHDTVDHSAGEYVKGEVHTNGMENFWSLVKRCLKGTYVAVAPWHLFRYLDEETFRFNQRLGKDAERFVQAMKQIAGKRLTYAECSGTPGMEDVV